MTKFLEYVIYYSLGLLDYNLGSIRHWIRSQKAKKLTQRLQIWFTPLTWLKVQSQKAYYPQPKAKLAHVVLWVKSSLHLYPTMSNLTIGKLTDNKVLTQNVLKETLHHLKQLTIWIHIMFLPLCYGRKTQKLYKWCKPIQT
jgi:hypothetical protein